MFINLYTKEMSKSMIENLLIGQKPYTGEQISELIEKPYQDWKKSMNYKRSDIEQHLYHRDLLNYVRKNYGH